MLVHIYLEIKKNKKKLKKPVNSKFQDFTLLRKGMKPHFKKDSIPRLVKRFIKVYHEDEPPFCYLLCDVETGLVYESSGEKQMCKEHKTQIKYNLDTHRFYCLDNKIGE